MIKRFCDVAAFECDGITVAYTDSLIKECRNYIKSVLSEKEFLEQLAEECIELAEASLKCIRAKGLSNNPTPTSEAESERNFTEEQLDVMSILWLLTENKIYEHVRHYPKYIRWAMRLGYKIPEEYILENFIKEVEA